MRIMNQNIIKHIEIWKVEKVLDMVLADLMIIHIPKQRALIKFASKKCIVSFKISVYCIKTFEIFS